MPTDAIVQELCRNLEVGTTQYGDAGPVSKKLFEALLQQGIKLVTKIRRNMKNRRVTIKEKFMLKRRALVETVIDLLKDIQGLWHSRHGNKDNGFNNMLAFWPLTTLGTQNRLSNRINTISRSH